MTICIATLCDDRKTIIVAADKMVGMGAIQRELAIKKLYQVHKNWWLMFSAEDCAPVFPIVDNIRKSLSNKKIGVQDVTDITVNCYQKERATQAEALYLKPRGWNIDMFTRRGTTNFTVSRFEEIDNRLQAHELEIDLLVTGFDNKGIGHIFSLRGDRFTRGFAIRHDIPGFHAIGSGSDGALFMMAYRGLSPIFKVRQALYFTLEGKYFGELAPGVGERTDLQILQYNKEPLIISEGTIEDTLIRLCSELGPRNLRQIHVNILNDLPELKGFKKLSKA
jgi:hypothetical protein